MTTVVPVTHTVVSTLYAPSCSLGIGPAPPPTPRTDAIIGGAIAGAVAVMAVSGVIQWRKELKEELEKDWKKFLHFLHFPSLKFKNISTNFGKIFGNTNVGDRQENTGGTYNYADGSAPLASTPAEEP